MSECPICHKQTQQNRASPFCSERCKRVDLGRWLNEEYRIPAEEVDPLEIETEERRKEDA